MAMARQKQRGWVVLGQRILKKRDRMGLTGAGLARRANVTKEAVFAWESGLARPNDANLYLVAQVLHTSVAALVRGTGIPNNTLNAFCRRLIEARRTKGYSQGDLAKHIGVTALTVLTWETGKAKPGPLNLPALAEALDVRPHDLTGEAPPPEAPPEPDALDLEGALLYAQAAAAEIPVEVFAQALEPVTEAPRCTHFSKPPATMPAREMTREELQHQRIMRAEELRRRARIHASYGDDDMAVNALALADLVEAHWPHQYPNLNIPEGEGAPARMTGLGAFSIGGSPAGQCVDGGM